uniref:BRO1 domain-containing protein n=1 Tax=Macrostomum lignano TaxID=282301 RepID=A0A1I8J6E9_9PLAT
MEGAPRIPMYSFQIKTSSLPIEIDVLKSYLESEYGESASAYDSEFKALLDLRKSALESPQDLGGLSLLKKYYGQLQLLKSRFPMEECEPCALPVSWDDLYIDDVVTHSDIRFEEAAVLYNIGSVESVLGCKQARTDAEGIKAACTHFMSAAWCFQRVSEVFSGAVAPDLESELMRLKAQMMLAQAQECVFRKSQLDGRKSGINARIAQQLVDFYGQLGSMLSSAGTVAKVIPGRTRKHYSGIFAVKRSFYESQVAYYSAQTAEDTGEYGLRLAWLLKARESLQAAIAANKDLKDSEMRETLNFVQDVIVGKHESAEKDNNLIYHAQIPQTVPEVQSAQLVKPLAFDPAEAAGPDLFKRLVPMKTSEASSVYSEEADPEFYSVSEDAPLPQALYDACAQLSVEGDAAQKRLTQRMQQLASAAVDVDTLLGELRQLTKDAPAETAASLRPFLDDLAKFEKVAREAQPSNDSLRASASRHAESLAELRKSPEELKASLPTVTDLQADEQLGQSVSELKRLLGKVSEMRSQRAELLASIRSDLRSEDATSLLLRQPNQDPVQMFEATLAKQQDRLTYLNQNLAAQANILSALIEVHAKLAPHRQLIAQRRADREAALQRLVATWNEGPVLLDKVQEGVDFFTGLHRKLKVCLSVSVCLSVC